MLSGNLLLVPPIMDKSLKTTALSVSINTTAGFEEEEKSPTPAIE